MNYHPEGMYVWDAWYYRHRGESHAIYLQQKRPGSSRPDRDVGALGHAVSDDLVSWRELPPALCRGEPGTYDDLDLWTGCTIEHDGLLYLYYTARSSAEGGKVERIALATSEDGVQWQRRGVVIEPDSRFYCARGNLSPLRGHASGHVDCRDLIVVRDPESDWFYGFFAARRQAAEIPQTSVIGLCRSRDLVNWEQMPPAFAPDRYACVEVPDVFCLDGRWYMTCLTGNVYGQRFRLSDPGLGLGTIYAVADRLQGPYHEPDENVLIGSTTRQGFSCRTIQVDGVRYLMYTQSERNLDGSGSDLGCLTTPKLLCADAAGHLLPKYAPSLEPYLRRILFDAVPSSLPNDGRFGTPGNWELHGRKVEGSADTDWSLLVFDTCAASLVYSATLTMRKGRSAGFVLRQQGDDVYGGAYIVLLDFEAGEVLFTRTRDFPRIEARRWLLRHGERYHLRVVAKGPFFEAYVDDVLALQVHAPMWPAGRLGLWVEQGAATFEGLEGRELSATKR
jgi:beta-fructofuranosidase